MAKSTSTFTDAQVSALETFAQSTETGFITNEDVKSLILTEDFAGKTVPAVRGKVVAMKLYQAVKAVPKSASGSVVVRKAAVVNEIETLLSLGEGNLASLEKASKQDLQLIVDTITALNG